MQVKRILYYIHYIHAIMTGNISSHYFDREKNSFPQVHQEPADVQPQEPSDAEAQESVDAEVPERGEEPEGDEQVQVKWNTYYIHAIMTGMF
mgnify:CR=1 FL=1